MFILNSLAVVATSVAEEGLDFPVRLVPSLVNNPLTR